MKKNENSYYSAKIRNWRYGNFFTLYSRNIKKFNSPVSLLAKESSKAKDILRGDKHIDKIITLDEEKDGLSGFFKLSKELKKINFESFYF